MEAKDKDKIADLLFRRKYTELIITEQLRLDQAIDYIEKAGYDKAVKFTHRQFDANLPEIMEGCKQAGIKEVVDFAGKFQSGYTLVIDMDVWQVKLKEWGIEKYGK